MWICIQYIVRGRRIQSPDRALKVWLLYSVFVRECGGGCTVQYMKAQYYLLKGILVHTGSNYIGDKTRTQMTFLSTSN